MERSRVGIIIPAYNEDSSIEFVVRECKELGRVIVIDDASSDNTSAIAKREGAEIVRHESNKGYDSALNSGFMYAEKIGCEFVITIDADGQHNPLYINEVILLLDNGADIVIGTRDRNQRLAEFSFAMWTRIRHGITDPLSGLKGYRISVYKTLGYFDSYNSIGTELMLYAMRNGALLKQFSIVLNERDGNSRFGSTLHANYKIFRSLFLSWFK